MAFLMIAGEAPATGLPRAIAEQLGTARGNLQRSGAELHDGVHDARRAIRRARAALELLRPQLDKPAWASLGTGIAQAGRALSPLRDAQSVIEAVDEQLRDAAVKLPAGSLQQVMSSLRRRRGQVTRRAAMAIATADAALAAAADPLQQAFADFDEAALATGLRFGRRRLRDAMQVARTAAPDGDALHRFRQRARTHWLQLELLSDAWPAVLEAQAAESKRLSQLLGSERDLQLLSSVTARLYGGSRRPPGLASVEAHIKRLRAQRLMDAFALGALVCAESGAALAERIRRWRRARAADLR
jgi:CHAD domain-containing protein